MNGHHSYRKQLREEFVMTRSWFVVAMALALGGCATSFTGDAHVEDGPAGCEKKCAGWGEEFVGMVAMGEYSDACVCRVRGKQVSAADATSVAGAAAGVVLQMRAAQQQRAAMMH
jgi:hypothetical protein